MAIDTKMTEIEKKLQSDLFDFSVGSSSVKDKQPDSLLNERKALKQPVKPVKLGDKNNSSTWSI